MKPNLESLPIELRQRIISFGSYETLCNVSLVNKAFHQMCNSTSVVKAIVDNSHGEGGQPWSYPHLTGHEDTTVWKSYAMADSKARGTSVRDVLLQANATNLLWAPQLMATKHPISLIADTDMIKTTFSNVPKKKALEGVAHSFCLVVACMHPELRADAIPDNLQYVLTVLRGNFWDRETTPQPLRMDISSNTSHGDTHEDIDRHYEGIRNAYTALAFLTLILKSQALEQNLRERWRRQFNFLTGAIDLPSPWTVPFHETMDIAPPFTESVLQNFASCHLARMTDRSFLETGEWVGYYSVPSGGFNLQETFDPPMSGLRFSVSTNDQDPELVDVTGYGGIDAVGPFTLTGSINVTNGLVNLRKEYTDKVLEWDWTGYLSPFGIVAAWGQSGWGGLVWLYEKSWVDE